MTKPPEPINLNTQTVRNIVLAEEYGHLGSKVVSERQRALMNALAEEPQVLFATEDSVMALDIVGRVELQHIGEEDRLLFPENHTHLHIQWCHVKEARKEEHRSWHGVTFHDENGTLLFGYWLDKPKDFSTQVHKLLGTLI